MVDYVQQRLVRLRIRGSAINFPWYGKK